MAEFNDAAAKVIRRSRGEAIDVATSAGLLARVCVLDISGGRVTLVCVGPQEVRFTKRTRQEAERHERKRRRA